MEQTPGSPPGSREAKSKAQQTAQRLKEQGKERLESGKEGAAEKAEQLADAVSRASDELHHQQEHGLADYASQVASGISNFADTLRHRSVDDLIAETESFARRSPAIFFLSSVGVGFALCRFLKASARHASAESDTEELEVSYGASSEWQQPEASQSIPGGQPGIASDTASSSSWSTERRGSDFEVRRGGDFPE